MCVLVFYNFYFNWRLSTGLEFHFKLHCLTYITLHNIVALKLLFSLKKHSSGVVKGLRRRMTRNKYFLKINLKFIFVTFVLFLFFEIFL